MKSPVLNSHIQWVVPLTAEQLRALPGSRQGFTAQFADGQPREVFSVEIVFPDDIPDSGEQDVVLRLLAPDNIPSVVGRLTAGGHLWIFRGPKTVAECVVLGVGNGTVATGTA